MQILWVSERADSAARAAVDALTAAGATVTSVGDVYAAIAALSSRPAMNLALLDPRDLDDAELSVIPVIARYFPTVQCTAVLLPGTVQRLARLRSPIPTTDLPTLLQRLNDAARVRLEMRPSIGSGENDRTIPGDSAVFAPAHEPPALPPHEPVELNLDDGDPSIERSLGLAGHRAVPRSEPFAAPRNETPAAPNLAPSAAPPRRDRPVLSTDGGPEAIGDGPTLHDAVRLRMSDGSAPPVRRRPGGPASNTPTAADLSAPIGRRLPEPTETGVVLTPAEIDALLSLEPPSPRGPDA